MQRKCENCDGSGLAGQGESPWLHHGHVSTCGACGGTGKVPSAGAVGEALSTPANDAPEKRGGILGALGF